MNSNASAACPMCGGTIDVIKRCCLSCGESFLGSEKSAHETSDEQGIAAVSFEPAVSLGGTIVPRHLAASFDSIVAIIAGIAASAAFPESLPILRLASFIAAYLGYYLLFERFISATPGKLLTGLVVVQFDGRACTWRQATIRTLFRIVEVNPILLGGLPAAARIVLTRHRQRFGDHLAGTIVAPRRRIAKLRTMAAASPTAGA